MSKERKIGALIPGYNVEKIVADVLRAFSPRTLSQVAEVVVIDNHSTDDTFGVLRELQHEDGELARRLTVIRNDRNYGLGGSLKIGFRYMIDNGFSHLMIIHSDKQGDSEEIATNFLNHLERTPEVDAIMASRFVEGSKIEGYSRLRTVGNHVFNILTYLLTGLRMSDSGCGIVLLRTEVVKEVAFAGLSNSYFFNPQVNILLFANRSLRIDEIPLHWADAEAGSNLRAARYVVGLTNILVRYRLRRLAGRSGFNLPEGENWLASLPHQVFRAAGAGTTPKMAATSTNIRMW